MSVFLILSYSNVDVRVQAFPRHACIRPETETRPEPEINNPAEIQVSMSAICEGGLGATALYMYISETASQYVTADKPQTTAAFTVSQEIVAESNPNVTPIPRI